MNRRMFITSSAALTAVAALPTQSPAFSNLRVVEALQGASWVRIEWGDLKAGTIFRLRESDTLELCDEGTEDEISLALVDATPVEDPDVRWAVDSTVGFTKLDAQTQVHARVLVYDEQGEALGWVSEIDVRNMTARRWHVDSLADLFKDPKDRPSLIKLSRIEVQLPGIS